MASRRLVAPARRTAATYDPLFVDNSRAAEAGTDDFDPVTFETTKTYADGIEADGFQTNTLEYMQYKSPEVPPALARQIHDEIITALSGGDEGAQTVRPAAADTWSTVGAPVSTVPVRLLGSSDNRYSVTITATPIVPNTTPVPPTGITIGSNSNLTVGNGLFVPVGTVVTLPIATELWAVAPTGDCTVTVAAYYS